MKARRFDFYADDWLAGTMTLDPAERGIYITFVAAMYSHGGPIAKTELRRLCPCDLRVFNRSLDRLLSMSKLTLKGGYLSNKRCLTELQNARKRVVSATQNGRKGGRPSKDVSDIDKPTHNPGHKPKPKLPSPSPSPSPFKKESTPLTPRKRGKSLDGFEDWWKGYPHKVGKGAAEKAWPKALALASLAELSDGVLRYIASKPVDYAWSGPGPWLNNKRWLDQPAGEVGSALNGQSTSGPPPGSRPRPEDLFPEIKELLH